MFDGTTVIAVKKDGKLAIGADGQVTFGNTVLKHNAKKIRKLFNGKIVCGFAGSTADAFTLMDRFEKKLQEYNGQLMRASVELAKDWRTDKYLRNLQAMMIVGDKENLFIITGNGDVVEPQNGLAAIGSGGMFAQAAATALLENCAMEPSEIVRKSLEIAGDLCIYTNKEITMEELI